MPVIGIDDDGLNLQANECRGYRAEALREIGPGLAVDGGDAFPHVQLGPPTVVLHLVNPLAPSRRRSRKDR